MQKPLVALTALTVYCALTSAATAQFNDQTYENAVGVNLGWWRGAALSLKHFFDDNNALEARLSLWKYGHEACALYQRYGEVQGVGGLCWYAGAGAHIGAYNKAWSEYYPYRANLTYFGPDGIVGLDYMFEGAPINLSLDIQPRLDFPGPYFNIWGGLGIRYAF